MSVHTSNKRKAENLNENRSKKTKDAFSLEKLPENLSSKEIQQLLDNQDRDGIAFTLSVNNMKQIVDQLKSSIQTNQVMRLKYPESPEKFMKSEVDLEEDITRLKNLCASSDLINAFLSAEGFFLLVPLLSHANVDLAGTVASTIVDLTSPDVEVEDESTILNALLNVGITSFLTELLTRLDDTEENEDQDIITTTLQLVDNLLEMNPILVSERFLLESPKFLCYLIKTIRGPVDTKDKFPNISYNRCYTAELLSVILQHNEKSRSFLGNQSESNAIEKLLRCISVYRKIDARSANEEEFVANIGNSLMSLLKVKENQDIFRQVLGIDLMIRLLRDRRLIYPLALKITTYTLDAHRENCHVFIERLGLKSLFGIFCKQGVRCYPASKEWKDEDEYCLHIILHLCRYSTGTPLARVLNKFTENKFEKLERLLELHQYYYYQVVEKQTGCKKQSQNIQELPEGFSINAKEEEYLKQCDAGLFIVQCADIILIRLANMGNVLVTKQIFQLLNLKGVRIDEIISVIEGYIKYVNTSNTQVIEMKEYLANFLSFSKNCV
ncbi:beta-catenin-like protein 1 [Hylaeus volcanicus]|uniref:beta-catenin-like protein 1 n=1 Tax=Hylaeus volcanicus TaxID=313075 RepID=UPI0023B7B25B|nr:beta-catenin-like protein 1 [Hylaeus volcanicus]XP_053993773.1 beta-catenin-like protein 1 [Hylaeus volcanicus]XP_053993774.1 beta-catenin-like protein 1 [Hylaeus volcanicus]